MELAGRALDTATRALKGLGHGSIFLLLTLPFVTLANCSGPVVQYTGYQALRGVSFPAAAFQVAPGQYPDYGPDWWIAGIMVLAVIGIGSAWLGGVKGAFAGLGAAITAIAFIQPAISFFNEPSGLDSWDPEGANGALAVALALAGCAVVDLGWMAAVGWTRYRRWRHEPQSDRGGWLALALFSTSFLTLIGLGVAGLALLVLALRSPSSS